VLRSQPRIAKTSPDRIPVKICRRIIAQIGALT
jgi:hypothetical protein